MQIALAQPPRSLGHRAPLLWLVGPFAAGLVLAGWVEPVPIKIQLGAAAVAAGLAAAAIGRRDWLWAPALAFAMVCAGSATHTMHRVRLPAWERLPPREARLIVAVQRVYSPSNPRQTSARGRIVGADEHLQDLVGQSVYFSVTRSPGEPVPTRSAHVGIIGLLTTLPREPPADTFDGYLAAAGVNFKVTRGRIVAEEQPAAAYYRFCATAARRFQAILGLGIERKRPLLAGLLRAMMLGETRELSEEQRQLFMQSGTMHLFAISGLNIGVIATSIHALLLLLRLPGVVRFIIGVAVLWLFVDITGAAPSAVRAFIMAAFLQAAFVLREPGNPVAAMVASAFVVLLVSPLQLFSASFLMSYGIVTALLVLGLPLADAWLARWQPWPDLPVPARRWWQRAVAAAWRPSVTAVAVGIATTLVSLLTGVQFFGLLTPGALVANLALIPAAMVATLGGFVSLLCGVAGFTSGAILSNHAAALVLLVIEWLVAVSVKLPWAFLPARYVSAWIGPAALAALMVSLIFGYATRWRRQTGGWWPPFAIVALVLILGVRFE